MATSNLSHQISRPFPTACVSSRSPSTVVNLRRHLPPPPKPRKLILKTNNRFKWAIQLSLVEQSPQKSTFDMQQLVGFLYDDLTHLFDDQGIDQTAYDQRVFFRDPITKHDSLSGYLFNIALLKNLFRPQFQLHWVKPDFWDSIEKNEYFSFDGLLDVIKQLRIYKTPELESPKYQILKRTANYEVRQYDPFIVVEITNGDKLSGSTGFNDVAGLPNPNQETVHLRNVEGGIAAVMKFSGKPTEDIVREKEKTLRANITKDGLKPQPGCLLARYNDPGRTWTFMMRNEMLIWLDDFSLD